MSEFNLVPRTWHLNTNPEIKKIYEEVYQEALSKGYLNSNYHPPLYVFKSTTRWGTCRQKVSGREYTIGLNEVLLENPESARATLIHEFAHAASDPYEHHGVHWKHVGDTIGRKWNVRVQRCDSEESKGVTMPSRQKPAAYIVKCKKCNHQWNYQRNCKVVQYVSTYLCPYCKTNTLTVTHI